MDLLRWRTPPDRIHSSKGTDRMARSDEGSAQPTEQPIRARVPDHVGRGAFSTGVIVVTGQTEVILDFVQNLGRPHQIVARVVLPHPVLPQLVDALRRNMDLYRSRWGELPQVGSPSSLQLPWSADQAGAAPSPGTSQFVAGPEFPSAQDAMPGNDPLANSGGSAAARPDRPAPGGAEEPAIGGDKGPANTGPANTGPANEGDAGRRADADPNTSWQSHRPRSAQEIYDDLKIRDELLSGAYANAVMIGHGPHEFSFDFITNFFPHSAVSARVFVAAGQIPRLYDSLRSTWEQLRHRWRGPDGPLPPSA